MLELNFVCTSIALTNIFVCFQNCYMKKECKNKISENQKKVKTKDTLYQLLCLENGDKL